MNDLMELLQSQMGGNLTQALSKQLNTEPEKTDVAVQSAFTAILSGLSKNVSTEQGAQSFLGALDRDHDGSILNDLKGFLGGAMSNNNNNTSMTNGAGILNHVLGNKQNNIIETIAKVAGIDTSKSGQLLVTLAPMIMGLLGKMKNTNSMSGGSLVDLISKSGQPQPEQQQSGLLGVFTKMLDQDGDGSVMDDIAGMGMKSILGGFFK
jgi:hypothetical protein